MAARLSAAPADFGAARFDHPIHAPLRTHLATLRGAACWPDCAALNALAGDALRTAGGRRLRFVPPDADPRAYELRVAADGEVPTRAHSWHDLFNALAWIAYPRLKSALNARHAAAMPGEGGRRGRLRDLLTLFDEGGAIALCADPALEALARAQRWRELFWDAREAIGRSLRVHVAGHAVLEQALEPWPGITCKALFVAVPPALLEVPAAQRCAHADAAAAAWVEALPANATPGLLPPLPVFGLPGWDPRGVSAQFYEDTRWFRPLRREAAGGG